MRTKLVIPIILPRIRIDGRKGFREVDMVLDTGAIYTCISWDVAKDIGYDPAVVKERTTIVTANGVVEVPLLTVKSISLEELKAEKIKVICHDIPEIIEVEGLLGLSFLKHFKTVLNFKENSLEII